MDSGASKHYFRPGDKAALTNIKPLRDGPKLRLPDGSLLQVREKGTIPLSPIVPVAAGEASIVPNLRSASLLSVGQFTDFGCTAELSYRYALIKKAQQIILRGYRNFKDGLWDVRLPTHAPMCPSPSINAIIKLDPHKSELADFLHGTLFSPCPSTLSRAIRNKHFLTWPGIDKIAFGRYVKDNIATKKGHFNQERKNLRSTASAFHTESAPCFFPSSVATPKTYTALSSLVTCHAPTKAFGDLTGQFPFKSSRGNTYIYLLYDYDSNAILVEAVPNRQAQTLAKAWEKLTNRLRQCGHSYTHFVLDNELSADLKQAFKKYNISHECVPPNIHRRNSAERAIQTFKNHLLAGLATCHKDFPINEWDRLLPQAEITLNLLRTSRNNPRLSAYAFLFGQYDYNAHPMVPPGTKVIVHQKPATRLSWAYHGKIGWYIGPSLDHYRCVRVYMPSTHSVVIADTVEFLPERIAFPHSTTESYIKQTLRDLLLLLKKKNLMNVPQASFGDPIHTALQQIADVLQRHKVSPAPNKHLVPTPNHIGSAPRVPKTLPQVRSSADTDINQSSLPNHHAPVNSLTTICAPRLSDNSVEPRVPTFAPTIPIPTLPSMPPNLASPATLMATCDTPTSQQHAPPPTLQSSNAIQHNKLLHIYDDAGKRMTIDKLIVGSNKQVWKQGLSNELGRLSNGFGTIKGTNTIAFVKKSSIPKHKKVTYANMVCDLRPLKWEKYRVRLTIGGDRLDCTFDTASPAASLLESKLLINSVISDAPKNARFMTLDIKDFFLQSLLKDPEYMRIHAKYFTEEFRKAYNLYDKINADGYVYCIIQRGMYGLKQAAILAYEQLVDNLRPFGYAPVEGTTGLWAHTTRPTKFALCVDDFGVKYFSNEDALHLISALKTKYEISQDWSGSNYCGLQLKWNYKKLFVDVSMPKYIPAALRKYQHPAPSKPQYAPHKYNQPVYGRKVQYAPVASNDPILPKKRILQVQSKIGTCLYYARGIDPTILVALNELSTDQAKPTAATEKALAMLLDYLATYPNAVLRFVAGTMQLKVESDASYLAVKGAKSRIAGHFYLEPARNYFNTTSQNGPVATECVTLKNVVCSAAEAECGGLFHNCQKAIEIRRQLEALGHPQQPTEVKTDNSTANSFVHATMRLKRSKTWDMRWNWLRQKAQQKVFKILWEQGSKNKADYFTKHHNPAHHRLSRTDYVLQGH